MELRKIDKSSAAEQFVYSTARLRANELERITYSHGLSLSLSFSLSLFLPCSFTLSFSFGTRPSTLPPFASSLSNANPTVLLLLLDPFYPAIVLRPVRVTDDTGIHTRSTAPVYTFSSRRPILRARSFQLLTGSSVGKRGYLRPPAYPLIPSSLSISPSLVIAARYPRRICIHAHAISDFLVHLRGSLFPSFSLLHFSVSIFTLVEPDPIRVVFASSAALSARIRPENRCLMDRRRGAARRHTEGS